MSKGLETWKLVRKYIDYNSSFWLKEQRHIETVEGHSLDIIDKELKALEIIKSIGIGSATILIEEGFENGYGITEEEYDLLKEVLL